MFETDYVAEFQDIIDSTKPKYKCIKKFNTINVDDIATVNIRISHLHHSICVTSNRHAYYVNSHTLDTHFVLLGKEV